MIQGSGRWEIILFVNVFTRGLSVRERNQCLAGVKKYYANLFPLCGGKGRWEAGMDKFIAALRVDPQ